MECREVRQLDEAYVSEQLLIETTQAVVAHLERCPACRAEIDDLRRLRGATRSAFDRDPAVAIRPEFASALTARLRAGAARSHVTRMPRRQWLALAASLVAGVAWGWREWTRPHTPSLARVAVGDHRFCALTFRLAEPPIPLAEAARRFGPVYSGFETTEPSTTSLRGGPLRIVERHSCVYEGRRFVHLVLHYRNEPVSLLVAGEAEAPTAAPGDASITTLPRIDGFHVASLARGRRAVFLVSSLDDEAMQEVARAMIGPVSRALSEV